MTTKEEEDVQHAQTVSPVKQDLAHAQFSTLGNDEEPLLTVDVHELVILQSQPQEQSSTDNMELIEKTGYPGYYQPAPEKNPSTEHGESDVLSTTPPKVEGIVPVGGTPAATTSVSGEVSEPSVTESPHRSPEVPRVGEDHNPDVNMEHTSETGLIFSNDISGQPEEASTGTVEEISAPTTEGTDVHSTSLMPSFNSSSLPRDSGEDGENPILEEDSVSPGVAGLDNSEVISAFDSGKSSLRIKVRVIKYVYLH